VNVAEKKSSNLRTKKPAAARHDSPALYPHDPNGACASRAPVRGLEVNRSERLCVLHLGLSPLQLKLSEAVTT
jgi:hypothetical protein